MPEPEYAWSPARLEQAAPALLADVLRRCGEARLRVAGTSMLPAIRPADVLVIRPVDIASVDRNDVILFQVGQRLFVHRVVHAGLGGVHRVLITRGDMHAHDDQPVRAANLLGRVEGQLRRGAALPLASAPRHRSRSVKAGRGFGCVCAMRRYAHIMRSAVSRAAAHLRLLGRPAKPFWRSSHGAVQIRERQRHGGPAWIS